MTMNIGREPGEEQAQGAQRARIELPALAEHVHANGRDFISAVVLAYEAGLVRPARGG